MINKIKVKLKTNAYNILISDKEQEFLSQLKRAVKSKNLYIITDKNVAKIHLKPLFQVLKKAGFGVKFAVLPAGESGKSIKSLSFLYDDALKNFIDRKSCVVALGGGVVGDVAGFFAATYMRGIKFIQIPTTLLAMADSSVGGKTAVNTLGGKNIAGAFYQPSFVWISPKYLETLSARQIRNGLAEVIKYAFIFDNKFYNYLQETLEQGIISSRDFSYMIAKSCSFKAKVVEKDEKETKGTRELLNFGHTLAHAIETATGYKQFLHGEAVAIGMLFAARLSVELKLCKKETYNKVENLLKTMVFGLNISPLKAKTIVNLMKQDKKSLNGNIRFVLLKDIGKSVSGIAVDNKKVEKALRAFILDNKKNSPTNFS